MTKPIYGMPQSGRRLQRTIFPWFQKFGMTPVESDPCIFKMTKTRKDHKSPGEEIMIIGVYVDDLMVLYSHDGEDSLFLKFKLEFFA